MSNPFEDTGPAAAPRSQNIFAVPVTAGASPVDLTSRRKSGSSVATPASRRVAVAMAILGAFAAFAYVLVSASSRSASETVPTAPVTHGTPTTATHPVRSAPEVKPGQGRGRVSSRPRRRRVRRHGSSRPRVASTPRPQSISLPRPTRRAPVLPAPVPAGAPPEFM